MSAPSFRPKPSTPARRDRRPRGADRRPLGHRQVRPRAAADRPRRACWSATIIPSSAGVEGRARRQRAGDRSPARSRCAASASSRSTTEQDVPVALFVDLDQAPERLPEPGERARCVAGVAIPTVALDGLEASAPLKVEAALRLFGPAGLMSRASRIMSFAFRAASRPTRTWCSTCASSGTRTGRRSLRDR